MPHPLSTSFVEFSESECKDSSPLYYALSRSIAADDSLLDIAQHSTAGQPVPNLLFASVHYLLSANKSHPLAAFYATFTPSPANPDNAYPAFRDFVLGHADEIIFLLKSRFVQTNEVRRCAYLFPAFLFAASHFDSRPLALVEIGTSAGLNLLWDKYSYSYDAGATYGDPSSEIHLTSSFRGENLPALQLPIPSISHRIGLDLNIVDTLIPDQAAWLGALVWPEQHDRRNLLEAALKKRSDTALDLRTGDGFSMLPDIVREIPIESIVCVYHTHVANQISLQARQDFLKSIDKIGKQRDVIHLFNNIKPNLHLTIYRRGEFINMPLANTDGHARWIEWLLKS
ncbi:DUF2332 domain-containing protein [bacterium]|nr:MAG: DUF2332 domain-containing protein [bacterium]